jgi:HD-GYP domain-containing protein (c-di-GMP phosphodiesterase class II)
MEEKENITKDFTLEISHRKMYRSYLWAATVIFLLATTIIFSFSAKNWLEQRTLLDLYYLPVIVAAIALGWRWGLFFSLAATVASLILYILIPMGSGFKAQVLSEGFLLRTIALNLIGIAGGYLSDVERKEKINYFKLNVELNKSNTKLQQRILELSMLYDTARQISSTLNIDNIIQDILDSIMKSFHCNAAFIYLASPETEKTELRRYRGIADNRPSKILLRNGKDYFEIIQESPEIVFIPDLDLCRDYLIAFDKPEKTDIQAFVCVPLLVETRFLGLIIITTSRKDTTLAPFNLEMIKPLAINAALAIDNAINYQKVNQAYVDIIGTMVNSIESQDLASIHQCQRTMTLATELGTHMKLPGEDIIALRYLLMLNHMGQISSDKLMMAMGSEYASLLRTNEATKTEQETGLSRSVRLLDTVAPIIAARHEWYDGGGMPDKKATEQIPLAARIFCLVDFYHHQVFGSKDGKQKRHTVDDAIRNIKILSGKQFDPEIVDAFIKILKTPQSE